MSCVALLQDLDLPEHLCNLYSTIQNVCSYCSVNQIKLQKNNGYPQYVSCADIPIMLKVTHMYILHLMYEFTVDFNYLTSACKNLIVFIASWGIMTKPFHLHPILPLNQDQKQDYH